MTELSLAEFEARWAIRPPQRIMIVGSCGSGKSTLAEQLGQLLELPAQDIDELYWLPGWRGRSDAELRAALQAFVAQDAWALAGNYSRTQDVTWPRAELVIWLDLPLNLVFRRVFKRCLRRWYRREVICNGNRESLRMTFLSRESLLLWLLRSYHRQRRQYLARRRTSPLPMLRLRSPAEVARLRERLWLLRRRTD